MTRTARVRPEHRLREDAQLLVRFSDDHDPAMALRIALREAEQYRVVPGYERRGAITISAFVVTDEREARLLTAGIGQQLYGLTTVGEVREQGYETVATEILEDGMPIQLTDRHVDVIVMGYPDEFPTYTSELPPAERRRLRTALLEPYNQALRLFDPRYRLPEGYHGPHE